MSDGIDLSAAPTKRRRYLARVLTVAGVSAGAWFAISLASTANAQSPIDDISAALQDVSSSTAQAVSTVSDAARPVVDTAARTADPVVQAAVPVVAGAADLAAPVVEQAADAAEPVLDEVAEVTAPIVEQVSEVAAPVVDQVDDLTVPVVEAVAPIVDQVATVTAPVVTLTEPVLESVSPVLDPVAAVVAPVVEAIDRPSRPDHRPPSWRPVACPGRGSSPAARVVRRQPRACRRGTDGHRPDNVWRSLRWRGTRHRGGIRRERPAAEHFHRHRGSVLRRRQRQHSGRDRCAAAVHRTCRPDRAGDAGCPRTGWRARMPGSFGVCIDRFGVAAGGRHRSRRAAHRADNGSRD